MFRRWLLSIIAGIVTAAVGTLLKSKLGEAHQWIMLVSGYAAGSLVVTALALLITEYSALSRLGPDLADEHRKLNEKEQILHKLRA